jgi:hypothetical protein
MIRDFVDVGPSFLSDRHKTGGIPVRVAIKSTHPKSRFQHRYATHVMQIRRRLLKIPLTSYPTRIILA